MIVVGLHPHAPELLLLLFTCCVVQIPTRDGNGLGRLATMRVAQVMRQTLLEQLRTSHPQRYPPPSADPAAAAAAAAATAAAAGVPPGDAAAQAHYEAALNADVLFMGPITVVPGCIQLLMVVATAPGSMQVTAEGLLEQLLVLGGGGAVLEVMGIGGRPKGGMVAKDLGAEGGDGTAVGVDATSAGKEPGAAAAMQLATTGELTTRGDLGGVELADVVESREQGDGGKKGGGGAEEQGVVTLVSSGAGVIDIIPEDLLGAFFTLQVSEQVIHVPIEAFVPAVNKLHYRNELAQLPAAATAVGRAGAAGGRTAAEAAGGAIVERAREVSPAGRLVGVVWDGGPREGGGVLDATEVRSRQVEGYSSSCWVEPCLLLVAKKKVASNVERKEGGASAAVKRTAAASSMSGSNRGTGLVKLPNAASSSLEGGGGGGDDAKGMERAAGEAVGGKGVGGGGAGDEEVAQVFLHGLPAGEEVRVVVVMHGRQTPQLAIAAAVAADGSKAAVREGIRAEGENTAGAVAATRTGAATATSDGEEVARGGGLATMQGGAASASTAAAGAVASPAAAAAAAAERVGVGCAALGAALYDEVVRVDGRQGGSEAEGNEEHFGGVGGCTGTVR